jgi:uncharacterized protein (TIGR00299 family) protein
MSFPSSADTAMGGDRYAIHLDLVGGLAGDMFVAALVDAMPELAQPVLAELAAINPHGAPMPRFDEGRSGGLSARRFGLAAPSSDRGHGAHAHEGRRYAEIRRTLEAAPLPAATRRHALALLRLLGDAEARVHGVAIDEVHFHELADWDSLLDIVAAGTIAGRLESARWSASALPLGSGTVKTAHGRLPVPAPATAILLTGYPWHDDGIPGERVTPTGAAILRHLVPPGACGGAHEAGTLRALGHGAGTRELAGAANIVRALVFDRRETAQSPIVGVIEFDVDDMTGEEIALAAERLRAQAGVIDVSFGTRYGKKGRPQCDFRVLADPAQTDAIAALCLGETSTLGLRLREERRRVLPRTEARALVDGRSIGVKIAERPDGTRTAKAAHDDVASVAPLDARRRLRAAGEKQAVDGEEP